MSLTVTELAEEVRESNRRLTQAVEGLGRKFDDVRVEVANLRVEMANSRGEVSKELDAINTNLEAFKGRVETSLGVAKWSVNIMAPVVVSLVAFAVGGAWYIAKLDSRVDRLEPVAPRKEVRIDGSGSDHSHPSLAVPHPGPKDQKSPTVPK
jgi:hypothetical protein